MRRFTVAVQDDMAARIDALQVKMGCTSWADVFENAFSLAETIEGYSRDSLVIRTPVKGWLGRFFYEQSVLHFVYPKGTRRSRP